MQSELSHFFQWQSWKGQALPFVSLLVSGGADTTVKGSFPLCLSCFSVRLESPSLCLSARWPCSHGLRERQIFTYLRLILLFTHLVVSNSLRPHGLQLTRLPCPSPSSGACWNSCPVSWWCHPTISSSVTPLLLLPSIFPSFRVFSSELALCIKWPNYWNFSFNISPSSEYSGLISFRMDWLNLLAV